MNIIFARLLWGWRRGWGRPLVYKLGVEDILYSPLLGKFSEMLVNH